MIDTVKLSCDVTQDIKDLIESSGQVKNKFDLATGEIYYNVVQNKVEGSYSSNINLTFNIVGYDIYKMYIECSLHKVLLGQNAYNGFNNLINIVTVVKKLVESAYNVVLPTVDNFFLERVDVARVFDLESQENIYDYLYIISFLSYPRRKVIYIEKESLYIAGRTCTLKIYNKYLEFLKNDKKKLVKINAEKMQLENENCVDFFNIIEHENKIKGYLRFELEIHKRMLQDFYGAKEININKVKYADLLELWKVEFMKLYSFKKEENVCDRIKIKKKLIDNYGSGTGNTLYNFYLRLVTDGESYVKNSCKKSTFYRNRKKLQDAGIDFSKRFELIEKENCSYIALNFNPFLDVSREVV